MAPRIKRENRMLTIIGTALSRPVTRTVPEVPNLP
jgi:hypothetical protein